ncbi:MAG: glycerophosphodiester phosphodiesterase [Pirellulales bacterium]|nr:glycerophosphodiester phosphodiesterase [Pirellulales bacterium]
MPLTTFAEPNVEPQSAKMEIVGHRGASENAPENTISAFKLGFAEGADGCELDFRTTKDGKLVIGHDDNTKRCAGLDKPIVEQTFDELRALEVGRWGKWKGKGFTEKMPTLEEALATVPAGRKIFLHCYSPKADVAKLKKPLAASGLKPEQVVFISFEIDACKEFKKLFPNYKAYWLASYKKKSEDRPPTVAELIRRAKTAGVEGIDLESKFPIDKAFVEKVHRAGLEMHVWTVDDEAVARKLMQAGVDSITTNRPGRLRDSLNRTQ